MIQVEEDMVFFTFDEDQVIDFLTENKLTDFLQALGDVNNSVFAGSMTEDYFVIAFKTLDVETMTRPTLGMVVSKGVNTMRIFVEDHDGLHDDFKQEILSICIAMEEGE
jgi:hypothetical protein